MFKVLSFLTVSSCVLSWSWFGLWYCF